MQNNDFTGEKDTSFILSDEQTLFVNEAQKGINILVDACIGSGKTSSIQYLCNILPPEKKILYLTYNRLLKLDAKSKIRNSNATVTNYHSFAKSVLNKNGINVGVTDLIQEFLKIKPKIDKYDVLIIDEYQDIEQELSELLNLIKQANQNIQIIAVGDLQQKIYDKSTLDVSKFIKNFIGNCKYLCFTKCFRLSQDYAAKLGRIWHKNILGVNKRCITKEMKFNDVIKFISEQNPEDLLCLGSRNGKMSEALNIIESKFPEKFNKKTVYASINDNDSCKNVFPKTENAIFTTYDSSKGLERKVSIIFDYTESYWERRSKNSYISYEILRNIFCVACSRGKELIIFVDQDEELLSEKTISTLYVNNNKLEDVNISEMFDFKYREDIRECVGLLSISKKEIEDKSEIFIKSNDELIDLSPCIGNYQEEVFFKYYDTYDCIKDYKFHHENAKVNLDQIKNKSLNEKILFLTFLETRQQRYVTQVNIPFIDENNRKKIISRLSTVFVPNEDVQVSCSINFSNEINGNLCFSANGRADVVKNNIVYELKFVSNLTSEHFLQCACYIIALNLEKGILWNTKKNEMYEIFIPNKKKFLNQITKTITKHNYNNYFEPLSNNGNISTTENNKSKTNSYFAVIDTETNYNNKVMSIGLVISNKEDFSVIDSKYYIIEPEANIGGMFSASIFLYKDNKLLENKFVRNDAIQDIIFILNKYDVSSIFAYNASYDFNHLPELKNYEWFDIMKIAAYKQFNKKISESMDCYSTGKLKNNYGAENIYKLLSGNNHYFEKHNALYDALDELKIMQLLCIKIEQYKCASINNLIKQTKTQVISNNNIKFKNTLISYENQNISQSCNLKKEINNNLKLHIENSNDTKTDNDKNKLLSTKDVAVILGVSKSTVYRIIQKNELIANKINNRYVISEEDLNFYILQKEKREKFSLIFSIAMCLLFIALLIYLFFYFN